MQDSRTLYLASVKISTKKEMWKNQETDGKHSFKTYGHKNENVAVNPYESEDGDNRMKEKNSGVAVSGTRPCVLREYVYVNG
jgi:hypothetical protein